MIFRHDKFREWENNTHIPEMIMNMVNFIAKEIGYEGVIEERTINVYNRYGFVIGKAKGFRIEHCTFSYADGPSPDYSKELAEWLKGFYFEIEYSYGDNGKDSFTNWHDTYWTNEFTYKPSEVSAEQFME